MEAPTDGKDSTLLIPTVGMNLIGAFVSFTQLVEDWFNPVMMLQTRAVDDMTTLFTALLILLVHVFYCRRIWILSQHNILLCGSILLFALLHFAMECATVAFTIIYSSFTEFHRITPFFTAAMAFAAADDIIIAAAMFYILNTSRTGIKSTDTMVSKLVTYVITTGLLTAILDLVVIITFVTMNEKNLIYLAFFDILPNLYTNACLAMLNARATNRAAPMGTNTSNSFHLSSIHAGTQSQTVVFHKQSETRISESATHSTLEGKV
ncbi:hypothetical protein AN958_08096 [Leucoagaricus sp. SymC.cos]|nr:hypothetical protein AN958_08096 [Leucoagaricus sp. SymC.cos]